MALDIVEEEGKGGIIGAPMFQKYGRRNYMGRCYHGGSYPSVDTPLWGVESSVWRGKVVEEDIALRGNEPYLFAEHVNLIREKCNAMGIDTLQLPSADEMRERIAKLVHRNNYTPNFTLAHFVLWTERDGETERVDYAIFQSPLRQNVYEYEQKSLYLRGGDELSKICNFHQKGLVNYNVATEAMLAEMAERKGLDGACVTDSEGRIVRTTLGNIYLMMKGAEVKGVSYSHGGMRDAMNDILEIELQKSGYKFSRVEGFTADDVRMGNNDVFECFVCGAAVGVRHVMSVGTEKRFMKRLVGNLGNVLKSRLVV